MGHGFRVATADDVEDINEILNHPTVRPHIAPGDHPLDFAMNIGVTPAYCGHGGVLFAESMGFGDYLALSAYLPDSRGWKSVAGHHRAMDHFFTKTDAIRLYAVVAESNQAAIRNMYGLGFLPRGNDQEGQWSFELDWINWAKGSRIAARAASPYYENGWFNNQNEALMFGAFLETARGGWAGKGLANHNKWATFSGAPRIMPLLQEDDLYTYGVRLFNAKKLLGREVMND